MGKTKPGRNKFAMNPKVRALVRKRNKLRKEVATKRKEWLEASLEVRTAREEAKIEAWAEFVETLEEDTDSGKVWQVIRALDGVPFSAAPNEAICKDGRTVTTNKGKANLFAKHYSRVSSLTFSKDEQASNRSAKCCVGAQT